MDGGMFKQQSSYPSVLSQSNAGVMSHGRTVVKRAERRPHVLLTLTSAGGRQRWTAARSQTLRCLANQSRTVSVAFGRRSAELEEKFAA